MTDVQPQGDSTVADTVLPVSTDHIEPDPTPQGDTVVTDPFSDDAVQRVDLPISVESTAGQLRAMHYTVPAKSVDADGNRVEYADDEVPRAYAADTKISNPDDDLAIQRVVPPPTFLTDKTPLEAYNVDDSANTQNTQSDTSTTDTTSTDTTDPTDTSGS